ncbi:hypothetical protein THRCLA_11355 [Thraustotheca clavata]|uniref:Uncharacterized protein n=1 Tax=Thraustotheca clavata TaxID=74557 RepID=A0A1V9Y826_9STRA|nr:hypothetical protein THRCLA_11355 [Thraustotheca clavata]
MLSFVASFVNATLPERLSLLSVLEKKLFHVKLLPVALQNALVEALCALVLEDGEINENVLKITSEIVPSTVIGYPLPSMARLLERIVQLIVQNAQKDEGNSLVYFQTIANFLHGNVGVRLFLAERQEKKELVRILAMLLNRTNNQSHLIYSMSILARLVLQDKVGQKLFQPKNIVQTIEIVDLILMENNVLEKQSVELQMVCIDLLADLATQPSILTVFEDSEELFTLTKVMLFERFQMQNCNIQAPLHYLSTLVGLSHRFRRDLIKIFPNFANLLPIVQHPIQSVAIQATKFFVTLLGDDKTIIKTLVDTETEEKYSTIIVQLFRFLHNTIASLVHNTNEVDPEHYLDLLTSVEYEHAVQISLLLTSLCQDNRMWAKSIALVNMTQLVALTQREAELIQSLPVEYYLQFIPRFSLAFLTLIGILLLHDDLEDDTMLREFNQALQIPEIATMISRGLCQSVNKQWSHNVIKFLRQFLIQSKAKGFHERISLMTLADGLFGHNQRIQDYLATTRSAMTKSDAIIQGLTKQLDRAKNEINTSKSTWKEHLEQEQQERIQLQQDFERKLCEKEIEYASLEKKCASQLAQMQLQIDEVVEKLYSKTQSLEKKHRSLQECRFQRCSLEEENNELKRKLHVLEIRIDEVAQAHAQASFHISEKDKERRNIQIEYENISEAYAAQSVEFMALQEQLESIHKANKEQETKFEATYKQLVLLAKAHKLQSDELTKALEERDQYATNSRTSRHSLATLEQRFEDLQTELEISQSEKSKLEKTIHRYEHQLHETQLEIQILQDNSIQTKQQISFLENQLAIKDNQLLEKIEASNAKDKLLSQRIHDIDRLKSELKKHTKVQALIHQLSSHTTENVNLSPIQTHYVQETQQDF